MLGWDTTDNSQCTNEKSIVKQLKKARGMSDFKAGLVTNTFFTHATPASAFGCLNHRLGYGKLVEQFDEALANGIIDVSFSGGKQYDSKISKAKRGSKIKKVYNLEDMERI